MTADELTLLRRCTNLEELCWCDYGLGHPHWFAHSAQCYAYREWFGVTEVVTRYAMGEPIPSAVAKVEAIRKAMR